MTTARIAAPNLPGGDNLVENAVGQEKLHGEWFDGLTGSRDALTAWAMTEPKGTARVLDRTTRAVIWETGRLYDRAGNPIDLDDHLTEGEAQ